MMKSTTQLINDAITLSRLLNSLIEDSPNSNPYEVANTAETILN